MVDKAHFPILSLGLRGQRASWRAYRLLGRGEWIDMGIVKQRRTKGIQHGRARPDTSAIAELSVYSSTTSNFVGATRWSSLFVRLQGPARDWVRRG